MDSFFNKVGKAYQIFRISKVSTSRQLSTVFSCVSEMEFKTPSK